MSEMIAGWPALTEADRVQLKELRDWLHVLARMDDRPQHAADSMLIARLIDENEALRSIFTQINLLINDAEHMTPLHDCDVTEAVPVAYLLAAVAGL